ncbi:MAG: 3D domain-containing protein [Kiritimatiellae bacterium]|nr:3D domain-containing protein [Kiritimatiellia bacterium]
MSGVQRQNILLLLLAVSLTGCARIRPPRGVRPVGRVMMTTGYCKCGKCCGWKRTWYGRPVFKSGSLKGERKKVGYTATNVRAHHGTIAADTSRYPFGTVMYIEGYGYGRVEDRGGAIQGEHIDLFFRSHAEALDWGRRRKKVKVWFVR